MAKSRRESAEELRERAKHIVTLLKARYPRATTALRYSTAHELLVATVLAAQCTDKKVNEVTESLFKKYRSPGDFAAARRATLEREIRPTGFFRNKAKSIIELSKDLVENHGGVVPDSMEELVKLRGVGRKTANVVLAAVFGRPGIIVDTHMIRIATRLGFTTQKDPVKIEFELMDIITKRDWGKFSFTVTLHGREVCKAPRPLCHICVIEKYCPSSLLKHEA
ncbi:MAG TPA: endonuclease III [bacterium]|nr:endonuclease III [bacterium]